MKRFLLPIIALSILSFSSCKVMSELGLKPTNFETVLALKSVLDNSTVRALRTLKDINNDGINSALPKEVGTVLKTLKTIGYKDEIEQVTNSISTASTIMLTESEGIVSDAVKELKFSDAVAVVLGGEDAATNVLKRAMYDTVKKRYSARLEQELAKTDALEYWPLASGAYNVFAKNKVDTSLSDFLAERAVDALFIAMGKQEASIRTDYKSIGDNVVNKVFDYYSKK